MVPSRGGGFHKSEFRAEGFKNAIRCTSLRGPANGSLPEGLKYLIIINSPEY